MSVTIIPLIRYDKKLATENDEKRPRSVYAYRSTIKMLDQLRVNHGFDNNDDMLIAMMLEYNNSRASTQQQYNWPAATNNEIPIAIASDPDRVMNRHKRKHGKSLDPDRRKVFEVGNSEFI